MLPLNIVIPTLVRDRQIRLLERIDATGSITAAAKQLGMGYPYAWHLLQDLNRQFREPLVIRAAGGNRGGGTILSDTGREVIALLGAIEAKAREAVADELTLLGGLLSRPWMHPIVGGDALPAPPNSSGEGPGPGA